MTITDRLTEGVRTALAQAGLPTVDECLWEVPRQVEHGDYAANVAMQLARAAKKPPRQIAEAIVRNFPRIPEVERVEVAGPGFLNVFLSPAWSASTLRDVLGAGDHYGRTDAMAGRRVRVEFVSANPTGPLVIVNARSAAVGDSLARLLRGQGADVVAEYYINDAGTQFEALARSFEARVRQTLGQDAPLPENGYPGEYLSELALAYRTEGGVAPDEVPARGRLEHFGRHGVAKMVEAQRRTLRDYGVEFDAWTSEQHDVRDKGLPESVLEDLRARGLTYEQDGALWFRSTQFGDDKDRVVRRSNGELTYFGVDVAFHHYRKFGTADRVIDLVGPDHHGYVERMRAAMQALGHPPEAFEVLIIQLVTEHSARVESGTGASKPGGKRGGALIPAVRIRRDGLQHHCVELLRDMGIGRARRRRSFVQRPPHGQHLVEDGPDGIDVGPVVRRLTASLLGRVVIGKAGLTVTIFEAALDRQVERRDLGVSLGRDDNGIGAEAAVHESRRMRLGDGIGDLDRHIDRAPDVDCPPRHFGTQRSSLQKLKDDEDAAVVLADIEDRYGVRV